MYDHNFICVYYRLNLYADVIAIRYTVGSGVQTLVPESDTVSDDDLVLYTASSTCICTYTTITKPVCLLNLSI